MADRKISRRDLLTFWRKPELPATAAVAQPPVAPQPGPFEQNRRWPVDKIPGPSFGRKLPLRPPGNMQEYILREACTRCNRCVEACPAHAIYSLDSSWNNADGTPAIDPRKAACVVCTGLQCTQACPSGALQPLYNIAEIKMGTAVVDRGSCLPFSGKPCSVCVDICPVPGALFTNAEKMPFVDEGKCIGCGLCVRDCPTQPTSIQVVPRD